MSGSEQKRLSGSRRPDGHELGTQCDVESCGEQVVGLDDGWEYERGIVCSSCIKYRHRHHHWPDEDADCCRECILNEGGAVHDCPETSIDVLLRPGDDCPNCGFELAATDGGNEAFSNGSGHIKLVDQDGAVATVRLICAGCGDEIDEVDVFEDQLENLPDTPIHDSVSCQKEASRDV